MAGRHFAARPGSIDRAGPAFWARRAARTREESAIGGEPRLSHVQLVRMETRGGGRNPVRNAVFVADVGVRGRQRKGHGLPK
ncbi:hypothetical protein GCM10009647_063870 [Streptomyces sanglieri]